MKIERLRMYKTAYSPLYGNYIEICQVYPDSSGQPIIVGRVSCSDDEILFRECELSEFCL